MPAAIVPSLPTPPVLELREVTRCWRPGILGPTPEVDALHRVSLRIAPGEFVRLIGPAGAGKTTLLMLASGEVSPSTGLVRWGGHLTPSEVRPQRIGPRPWEYAFLSVRQAIAFHADHLRLQDARRRPPTRFLPLLRQVGLQGRSRRRLGELSALDALRVVIAQALLARPALLCCDEPFAYCGPAERDEAARLLRRLTGAGIAVLIATREASYDASHEAAFDGFDRTLHLRAGRLVPEVRTSITPHRRRPLGLTAKTRRRRATSSVARVAEEQPPV